MEFINRKAAKEMVGKALQEVGDFSGDFEDFTFERFEPFHKKVFLNTLKNNVNTADCTDENGQISGKAFFDVQLSVSKLDEWGKMSECIDYVTNSHLRVPGKSGKIRLP